MIEEIFSQEGYLAKKLTHYENRPQQLSMAAAIQESIQTNSQLIVEAGTGVGKSFAYLVPFILWTQNEERSKSGQKNKRRVVISTYTKTLQEQLVNKDLPLLEEILPAKFKFMLCVGSENYICRRRLNQVWQYGLFDTRGEAKELSQIGKWCETTNTGLRLELDFEPKERVWSKVCREPDLCLGKKCLSRGECFYAKAKAFQSEADILVVNHYLFFANIASSGKVLPFYDAVVFDEAQNIEEVATEYLGIEISNYGIKHLLDSIYNPRTNKGLITRIHKPDDRLYKDMTENIQEIRSASDRFFTDILDEFGTSGIKPVIKRIHSANSFENILDMPLLNLSEKLKMMLTDISDDELTQEITAYSNRCVNLRKGLDVFIKQSYANYVYYLEIIPRTRYIRISLHASPVDIAQILKKEVFDKTSPVILTSATLSVNKSFQYIKERTGAGNAGELLLDSPFDYQRQVMLYIADGLPDPSYKTGEFQNQAIKRIKEILEISGGHAFVLFTSYETLEKSYKYLKDDLKDIQLIKQGDLPRWQMLENFKKGKNTVLLGTNTFWQGVDVPGCALQCVIIFKLPFSVPDNPVTEAKMEYLTKQGRDPFMNYQIPQAIIMLKQGFGRLIRTNTDYGTVAILDPRIKTRYYGRLFIESLPKCRITNDISELKEAIKRWFDYGHSAELNRSSHHSE